jgi:hypothetical protein
VRDEAGRPLTFGVIHTITPQRRVRISALGHYRLDSLPSGRVRLVMSSPTYLEDTTEVMIRAGQRQIQDIVARPNPTWTVRRDEQWLQCRADASRPPCTIGRRLENDLAGFHDSAAWVFRDSSSFRRFWLARPATRSPRLPIPAIDWNAENVLAVSYGGFSGCGPARWYVNRIERHRDTTVVVVGPDSTYDGPGPITCTAYYTSADILAIPVIGRYLVFRGANPTMLAPRTVTLDP